MIFRVNLPDKICSLISEIENANEKNHFNEENSNSCLKQENWEKFYQENNIKLQNFSKFDNFNQLSSTKKRL